MGIRASGGRLGTKYRGAPTILLTTKGRHSGKDRTVPLLAIPVGEGYAVTGSNGGHDRPPDWYHNLVANPDVRVQVGRRSFAASARVVAGPERDALYERFVAVLPTYHQYEEATSRVIPVVLIEPVQMP